MVPKHLIIARWSSVDCPSPGDWRRSKLKWLRRGQRILSTRGCIFNSNISNLLPLCVLLNLKFRFCRRVTGLMRRWSASPCFCVAPCPPPSAVFLVSPKLGSDLSSFFGAIWGRSTGGEGPSVPSLLLLSMAFGTYFMWMSGPFK